MSRAPFGGLLPRVFAAIVAACLASVVAGGLLARYLFSLAFDAYLASLPVPRMGRGMGRILLGRSETAFLSAVDSAMYVAAVAAVAVAALTALAFAGYLTAPLKRLRAGVDALARGDLSHRVEVRGPEEVEDLGRSFNSMADSLEHVEELRKRMVADVAHELRNPVAALQAQVEGMADGVLPVDEGRLASVADDVEHLSALIDDLQELSRAEAGELRYEKVVGDLSDLAVREVQRAAGPARAGVEVFAEGCDGPLTVEMDERRVSQVLRNLLANALRHTETGSVAVRCRRDGDRAVIEVADTGEGIPDEDMPYVFERFYRADRSRARETGGHGIGLAISNRIVMDHGGAMFVRANDPHGAMVGFWLPLPEGS